MSNHTDKIVFKKHHPDAQLHERVKDGDVGYDVELVQVKKSEGKRTWYTTGISVVPPMGVYFELVPRSSFAKGDYRFCNCVGVIDRGYTGEIIAVVEKLRPDVPDLELPARLFQLVERPYPPRRALSEVDELPETDRGNDGFGQATKKARSEVAPSYTEE